MNVKIILTVVLLVFVAGSIGYMIVNEKKAGAVVSEERIEPASKNVASEEIETNTNQVIQSSIAKTKSEDAQQNNQLVVYYFHGDKRCPTCHKLETYAKEALDTYFADEISSENIVWKVVNVDRTENSHFIQDYKLVTKSVVLSKVANGKEIEWKNLNNIWQKVRDKDRYLQYIRESILMGFEGKDS
ncbi:MAG: hypothetical protein JXB29_07525 [Sedimentisphaerales bacterium]|nr:hypothetical protein [Sedimentisphaerales bacterium]